MKKAIYLIIALIGLSAPSCSDSMLDFSPTDSGSGKELLKSASTAITSVNGVYRSMWTAGWSTTANTHQCFGIAAYNLALDCMADDLIMQSQGNGWFWNPEVINERVKMPCPKCGGTGKVKGIVTVEWVPDGEVKACFKENSNNV